MFDVLETKPAWLILPASWMCSLTEIGMPCSGPISSPFDLKWASKASAVSKASSAWSSVAKLSYHHSASTPWTRYGSTYQLLTHSGSLQECSRYCSYSPFPSAILGQNARSILLCHLNLERRHDAALLGHRRDILAIFEWQRAG